MMLTNDIPNTRTELLQRRREMDMSEKKSINVRRFMKDMGILSTVNVLVLASCSLMFGCYVPKNGDENYVI